MVPGPEGFCSLAQLCDIHDGIGLGVIVLDERHRVLSVSPLAQQLLSRNGLPFGSAQQRDLLREVIARSWVKAESKEPARIILRRPDRVGSLFIYVSRVNVLVSGSAAPCRHYVLLVRDPALLLAGEAKVLAEVFGLTRRESELACYLALGADLALFAKEKFVSVYTAKSHLKQIFRKMGVHRQSELVVNVLAVVL